MTELTAAYERENELTKALRHVRGELEVMASYDDGGNEAVFFDLMNLIDDALANKVL